MHSSLQKACDQIAAGCSPSEVLPPFCLQPTLSWFAALLYCIGMAIYILYPLADGEWGREQKVSFGIRAPEAHTDSECSLE